MRAHCSNSRSFVSIAVAASLALLVPVVDVGHRALAATAEGTNQPPPNTVYTPPNLEKIPGNVNTVEIAPNYTTPRENLTKVANALRMRTYSLSTIITVPGGLGLTQAVAIRVHFDSYSGSANSDYVEKLYDNARGALLIINDKEGLGTPRQATLRINLFEYPPGWTGGRVFGTGSFDFPDRRYNLDPLYDVSIRPIQVTRIQDCAMLTGSDVSVKWFSPDNQPHQASFRFGANKVALVPNSQWSAQEVNVSKNYHMPNVGLYGFHIPSSPSNVNLIPAPQAYAFGGPMPVQEIKFQAARAQ